MKSFLMGLLGVGVTSGLVAGCCCVKPTLPVPDPQACERNSICPLIVHEVSPGKFAVLPDVIQLKTGQEKMTLIWTFADRKYEFRSDPVTDADGVRFDSSPEAIGVKDNCYINKESKDSVSSAIKSRYFRCNFKTKLPVGASLKYTVWFHDEAGNRYHVDPTVETTFLGREKQSVTVVGPASAPPAASALTARVLTSAVHAGKTVLAGSSAQITAPGDDGLYWITWSVENVGAFDSDAGDRVHFYRDAAYTQEFTPSFRCTVSSVDGLGEEDKSPYYTCQYPGADDFSLYYVAKFTGSTSPAARSASGVFSRP